MLHITRLGYGPKVDRLVDRAAELRRKEASISLTRTFVPLLLGYASERYNPKFTVISLVVVLGRTFALDSREIAIVGRACRLPGAPNCTELWDLIRDGRCAVSTIPAGRWPFSRHGHPSSSSAGRSYTWAAGVLPDIWGFDPGVFRISPREAEQMDPQQRLLLELAFEACENAGFAPSSLAGTRTGVYVGASALDYSIMGLNDPAVTDAYYATGNTLSIISNRLSYIFDLHGPSLCLDTACSSSLVALHEACQALLGGISKPRSSAALTFWRARTVLLLSPKPRCSRRPGCAEPSRRRRMAMFARKAGWSWS